MTDQLHITRLIHDYTKAISVHPCTNVTEKKIRRGRLIEITVSATDARRVIGQAASTYRALSTIVEACREAAENQIILLPVNVDNRYHPKIKSFRANFKWNPDRVVFPMYLRFLEELGSASSGWQMVEGTNVADLNPEFPKLDDRVENALHLLMNVLAMVDGGNVISGHQ